MPIIPFNPWLNWDQEYDDSKMISELGLIDQQRIADRYRHYKHCQWAVIELKGAFHLDRAITQVRNTVKQLVEKKKQVDFVIVLMKKLQDPEVRRFRVDHKTHEVYERMSASRRVMIDRFPLHVFFVREKFELEEKGKIWEST